MNGEISCGGRWRDDVRVVTAIFRWDRKKFFSLCDDLFTLRTKNKVQKVIRPGDRAEKIPIFEIGIDSIGRTEGQIPRFTFKFLLWAYRGRR